MHTINRFVIIFSFVANVFETQFTLVFHAIFANEDGLQTKCSLTHCLTLVVQADGADDNNKPHGGGDA